MSNDLVVKSGRHNAIKPSKQAARLEAFVARRILGYIKNAYIRCRVQNTDRVRSTAEVTRQACIVTAKRGLPKLKECICVLRQISRFGVLITSV